MRIAYLSIVLICLVSCSDESRPLPVVPAKLTNTKPAALADLQSIIDRDGPVTFLSFNGEWIGSDIDSSITFFTDGQLHQTVYGIAIFHHDGSYSFDGSILKLVVETGDFDQPTQDFQFELVRDGDDLVLTTEDKMASGSFRQVDAEWNQNTVKSIADWNRQVNVQPQAVE